MVRLSQLVENNSLIRFPNVRIDLLHTDTHSKTQDLKLPEGDVLLHAGDFSNIGKPVDIERFCQFLQEQPHPHKVTYLSVHYVESIAQDCL